MPSGPVAKGPIFVGGPPLPEQPGASPIVLSGWAAVGHAPAADSSNVGTVGTIGTVLSNDKAGLNGMGRGGRFSERAMLSHAPLLGPSRRFSTAPAALGRPPDSDDEAGGSELAADRAPVPGRAKLVETAGVVGDEPEGSRPLLGGDTGFEKVIRLAVLASFTDPRIGEAIRASSAHGSEPQRGEPQRGLKRSLEVSEEEGSEGPYNPADYEEAYEEEEWEGDEDPWKMRRLRSMRGLNPGDPRRGK